MKLGKGVNELSFCMYLCIYGYVFMALYVQYAIIARCEYAD